MPSAVGTLIRRALRVLAALVLLLVLLLAGLIIAGNIYLGPNMLPLSALLEIAEGLLWPDGSGRVEMDVTNVSGHRIKIERFVLDGDEVPTRDILVSEPLHGEPRSPGHTGIYVAWELRSLQPKVVVAYIDLESGLRTERSAVTSRAWGAACDLFLLIRADRLELSECRPLDYD